MTRVNLILLLLVVASAFWLVRTAYDSRRLFAELHSAEDESARLAGEARRLEAEREIQATSLRVERTAREKLGMRTVTPAVTMKVIDPAATASAATVAAPAAAVASPTTPTNPVMPEPGAPR